MSDPTEQPKLDPLFKEVLTVMGESLDFTPMTEVEVSRLPRKIDAIIQLPNPADRTRLAEQTSFIRLRAHNQVEFKGMNDRLYLPGYQAIRGRMQFYLSQHKLNLADLSLFIVCAVKPTTLLNNDEIRFTPLQAGYYLSNEPLHTILIVVNELPLLLKHYPLILFASSKAKFLELLQRLLKGGYRKLLRFAYYVRPDTTRKELMISESAYLTEENLRFILNDIGEELMQIVPPELVEKSPAYQAISAKWEAQLRDRERVLKAEAQKARQKAKQQEQKAKLQEQKAKLQERQRTILRTLQFRFTNLSAALIADIEATQNVDLLQQWIDLAFEVDSLEQFSHAVDASQGKED